MTAPLRPMNLGEILDRTIQIYRSRFLAFVGIAALPALAIEALHVANYIWWRLLPEEYGPRISLGLTAQDLLYRILVYQAALVLQILTWPAISYLTSTSYLRDMATPWSAIRLCLMRWRSWLWLSAANWSIVLLLPEVVFFGLLLGTFYLLFELLKLDSVIPNAWGPRALLLTVALGWAAFLWLGASLSFTSSAWTLEKLTVGKSLRRSWSLSKASRLRIAVTWFMPAILGWVLTFAVSRALVLLRTACPVDYPFFFRLAPPPAVLLIGWCVSPGLVEATRVFCEAAIATLLGPVYPIAITLFYYDQRIRREGYDIERMMESAGLNPPETPPAKEGQADPGPGEVQA